MILIFFILFLFLIIFVKFSKLYLRFILDSVDLFYFSSTNGLLFFSSESGRDNPFRPDGDISKEADKIVQCIKSGRPLLEVLDKSEDVKDGGSPPVSPNDSTVEPLLTPTKTKESHSSPQKNNTSSSPQAPSSPTEKQANKTGANGSAAPTTELSTGTGTVEVTHGTVTPSEATHVEHIVIKKKSKCNCCVIQ